MTALKRTLFFPGYFDSTVKQNNAGFKMSTKSLFSFIAYSTAESLSLDY